MIHAARVWFLVLSLIPWLGHATPTKLGDLDDDGVFTANDLAKLVGHSSGITPLPANLEPFADLTQDSFINDVDHAALVSLILESSTPQNLPLASVREVSPATGEGDVAVTRETVVHFSMPLALSAALDTTQFYAEFGARKMLSRVEISSDRKKATLFYLEPLPSNARVQVTLAPTALNDLVGRPVDLDGDGTAGGAYTTSFDTLSITPVAGTAISGRVFASEPGQGAGGPTVDVPLAGVTVTVDGAEETLRTTTDAQGNFTLSPCPAGSFFVHIDGRTSPQSSYPNGNYYPSVGKRWEALAGRTDNLSGNKEDTARGTIYLPKILANALEAVSQSQDTKVDFPPAVLADNPALAGTELDVPANSLFADDGTRGGKVGIAPVAPDRLPSPLPPGLNLPMVITIQTDGATNFDRPVPITFPNLPDPVTGEKLPPGAKSALWSFNHDLGDWEVIGPMTVSEDGNFVTTDAGVGVQQPGWHGTLPGRQLNLRLIKRERDTYNPCSSTTHKRLLAPLSPELQQELVNRNVRQQSLGDDGFGLFAYDNYQLTAKLPANLQPEQVLQMMAKDLNGTIGNAQFDKINEFSTNSAPKVGDIYNIDIVGPVDGKVVLSRLEPNYFVFTTVADQAGNHPESGSREFGFQRNDDGTVTFYTRGASRNTDLGALSWGPFGAAQVLTAGTFQSLGWMALMEGLKNQLAASDARNIKVDDPTIFLNSDPSNCTNITPMRSALFAANIANAAGANTDETPSMVYYRLDYIRTIGNGEGFSTLRGQARNGGTARLVLPANVSYQITSFDPATGRIGIARGASTQETVASDIFLSVVQFEVADRDGDGLTDVAEFILATNEANPDTDGDGISDGAEVQQGSNPLNGFIATTGIIASVPTAAPATDIYALNNVAVTANGAAGISVFNVLSGLNPTRIADVDTPGLAMCVASNGNFVAVADYLSGLAIVDISDPAAVRLSAQVNLGAAVQSVTVNGGLAIAGTTTGQIVTVDLATATVLGRVNLPAGAVIQDLTVWRDTLYALQVGKLTALDVNTLAIQGSLTLSGSMGAGQRRWRLFAGEGTLYATHTSGFNIVDTGTNPNAPTLVQNFNTAQFGWKQIVANGSGLGLAATSPNSTNDGPHNIDLYTLGAEGRTPAFGTTFETPGLAAALSIYNGLAYVADSESGLQVISYLPYDSQGQAPTISIKSNFTLNAADKTGTAEEGKLMRLSATVTDDVQVRNVEFYVDGQLLITDGNYPFEHRFATPAISAGNPNFKVKAKATDTGGNVAWTDEFTITLVPDATPPQVLTVSPGNNAITGALTSLYASFSEPMNADTLATGFKLTEAGPDKSLGTADDVLSTGEISYRENIRTAFMTFASPGLQPGSYRITLQAPAADGAGNAIATPFLSSFRVYNASLDTDGDGIPDEYEALLGLNPTKADTNNNGILDGNEDFDNDGLKNSAEFYLMTNPIIADTNGNGILDGNEDSDLDGLKDGLEAQYGTNALLVDSDGDGFDDATEIAEGSDPNVGGNQRPLTRVRSSMVSLLNAAPEPTPANLATTAASATITYLNSTTEPLPGNLANAAASKAVSYLNAATEPLPPALDNAAASKAVSYLNAATEPLPASRDAQSGQVSYRNNP